MGFKNPECPEEQRQRLEAWVRQLESQPAAGRWAATYKVHLLTPIFGGGVVAGQPDPELPIRTREVLYQLRFWWRILKIAGLLKASSDPNCSNRWSALSEEEQTLLWSRLREEEKELFGWRGKKRSRVHAVIKMLAEPELQRMPEWIQNHRSLQYAFWSSLVEGKKCSCFDLDSPAFELRLELDPATGQPQQKRELEKALRWGASFGGLGARTRRGMGAVWVQDESGMVLPPVTEEEAAAADCTLKISPAQNSFTDPIAALGYGIRKLYKFRQGTPEGRSRRYGRSNWPEPDAIRRRAGHWDAKHDPSDLTGLNRPLSPDLYPRAAFGLPIQFPFKGGVDEIEEPDDGTRKNKETRDFRRIREENGDPFYLQGWEPTATQLVPENRDRLASPLILRPRIEADGRYRCIALRLPEPIAGLEGLTLSLQEIKRNGEGSNRNYLLYNATRVDYWNPAQADQVPPIANTKKTDPLDAFLEFFSRP